MIRQASNPLDMVVSACPLPEAPAPLMTARRYEVGRWLVIEAQGEIDLLTAPQLRELVDGVSSHVVFDLSQVTFIDACGLGVLAATRAKLNGAHGSMSVAGPTPQTRKLLALTGLDRVVEVYDSLGEALWGHASCS